MLGTKRHSYHQYSLELLCFLLHTCSWGTEVLRYLADILQNPHAGDGAD